MLVSLLSICSDDELMSDGDEGQEEGNVTFSFINITILLLLSFTLEIHCYLYKEKNNSQKQHAFTNYLNLCHAARIDGKQPANHWVSRGLRSFMINFNNDKLSSHQYSRILLILYRILS